jgi:rare lipoprotein A
MVDADAGEVSASTLGMSEAHHEKPVRHKRVAKKSSDVRHLTGQGKAKTDKAAIRPGQTGVASWYGGKRQGHRTASGERLDNSEMTAAHPTLPLHSHARVTNLANGRSVTVRVTDRGPHKKGRIIDVSQRAAEDLGMKRSGVARVRVEALSPLQFSAAPSGRGTAPAE